MNSEEDGFTEANDMTLMTVTIFQSVQKMDLNDIMTQHFIHDA